MFLKLFVIIRILNIAQNASFFATVSVSDNFVACWKKPLFALGCVLFFRDEISNCVIRVVMFVFVILYLYRLYFIDV